MRSAIFPHNVSNCVNAHVHAMQHSGWNGTTVTVMISDLGGAPGKRAAFSQVRIGQGKKEDKQVQGGNMRDVALDKLPPGQQMDTWRHSLSENSIRKDWGMMDDAKRKAKDVQRAAQIHSWPSSHLIWMDCLELAQYKTAWMVDKKRQWSSLRVNIVVDVLCCPPRLRQTQALTLVWMCSNEQSSCFGLEHLIIE